MELVPLTEDLAAASPADAELYLPLPPENPIENTPGKSSPGPSLHRLLHLKIPFYEDVEM